MGQNMKVFLTRGREGGERGREGGERGREGGREGGERAGMRGEGACGRRERGGRENRKRNKTTNLSLT